MSRTIVQPLLALTVALINYKIGITVGTTVTGFKMAVVGFFAMMFYFLLSDIRRYLKVIAEKE